MNKPIAFLYNNAKYFTFFGGEILPSSFPDTNAITFQELNSKQSYMMDMRKLQGGSHNNVAVIEDATIVKPGAFFLVSGTAIIDGAKYHVELQQDKIVYEALDAPADEVVNEVVEEVSNVEEVAEESVVAVPESEDALREREDDGAVSEEESEAETEEGETGDDSVADESVEAEDEEEVVRPSEVVIPQPTVEMKSSNSISFGPRKTVPSGVTFGTKETKGAGIAFGVGIPPLNATDRINARQRQKSITGRPIVIQRPVEQQPLSFLQRRPDSEIEKAPYDVSAEEQAVLMNKWKEEKQKETRERWQMDVPSPVIAEVPASEVSVPVVTEPTKDRDALKAEVRKDLSPEVNDVIGNIPIELLRTITEFTSRDVDTQRLLLESDNYCIDNRWHKQGKWFCIDVVAHSPATRYFFNSKLNVSIEIPIEVCKNWLNAIS